MWYPISRLHLASLAPPGIPIVIAPCLRWVSTYNLHLSIDAMWFNVSRVNDVDLTHYMAFVPSLKNRDIVADASQGKRACKARKTYG